MHFSEFNRVIFVQVCAKTMLALFAVFMSNTESEIISSSNLCHF